MNTIPLPSRRRDIHEQDRRIAQIISVLALGLMLAGFGGQLALRGDLAFPGPPAVLPQEITPSPNLPFLVSMTAGILLFAVLPAVRVLLVLVEYAGRWDWRNALIAVVVLLELVGSTQIRRM